MPFESTSVPAVKGTANAAADRIQIYTAEIPAKVVAQFVVDQAATSEGGFQRQLDERRAAQIGRLMGGDKKKVAAPGPNIHGGLLAYAKEGDVEFVTQGGRKLVIKRPLHLIDGQHRAAGAKWAVENGMNTDYTETVRVVVGATHAELALWYLRCNMEARKVPPANIIIDVASMEGTVMRRKSWISRQVVSLSQEEPFMLEGQSLVSFTPGDGGRIQAQSLYRAIDILLPPDLNVEGSEKEQEAVIYDHKALTAYAELFEAWGTQETGGFKNLDAYSFTMLAAWGRLCSALKEPSLEAEKVFEQAQKAFRASGLDSGKIPDHIGSGERAASALAAFAAGKANLPVESLSRAAA